MLLTALQRIIPALPEAIRSQVTASRDNLGREMVTDHESFKIEILEHGAFGWSTGHPLAVLLATEASRALDKRHRVYWSANGKAWMIRRAFMLGGDGGGRGV